MKVDLYEYFNNCLIEDKLPHAFLIESNNVDESTENVLKFLLEKKIILNKNVFNNINLVMIEPEGKFIKTESIFNLQDKFSTYPTDNKYNIFIIKHADKMNNSSSNKLLKFLEEPSKYIIGILITDSISEIIDTIKSRCQHFILNEKGEKIRLDEEVSLFFENYNKNHFESEIELKKRYKSLDRNDLILLFEEILHQYDSNLTEYETNKIQIYSKNIILLDKILLLLRSNVNIDLVLDKFFIELRK